MPINGVETALYGVDDVALCTRYFEDFGLPLLTKTDQYAHFRLEEGSNVIIRSIGDPLIPQSQLAGTGVHETVWGVDNDTSLEELARELGKDRELRRDPDGTIHCQADDGLAIGFRV